MFGGSGTAAVEAAIAQRSARERQLLVIDNGAYGTRMAEIAKAYRIRHDVEAFGVGGYPEVDRVARTLDRGGYTQLAVVHHETSTGMLNPVPALAARARPRRRDHRRRDVELRRHSDRRRGARHRLFDVVARTSASRAWRAWAS